MKVGRSSPLRTGRLYPDTHVLEAESTPGHMELSDAPEKISSDRGSIPELSATPGPETNGVIEWYFISEGMGGDKEQGFAINCRPSSASPSDRSSIIRKKEWSALAASRKGHGISIYWLMLKGTVGIILPNYALYHCDANELD